MRHHKLIKSLVKEIRQLRANNIVLRQEVDNLNDQFYDIEAAQSRLSRKNKELKNETYRLEQEKEQLESDQWSKDRQRNELLDNLDRAKSWGNSWEAERIERELRDL